GLSQPMTYLTADEAASLDSLVVRLESATGVQVVPAIVGKADTYPEVPWTAAAHALVVLGIGAVCALLAAFVPAVARLLLYRRRAEVEVRQYAESLFLRRTLSATRARTGL